MDTRPDEIQTYFVPPISGVDKTWLISAQKEQLAQTHSGVILYKKASELRLSGNEVNYTNSSILRDKNNAVL